MQRPASEPDYLRYRVPARAVLRGQTAELVRLFLPSSLGGDARMGATA